MNSTSYHSLHACESPGTERITRIITTSLRYDPTRQTEVWEMLGGGNLQRRLCLIAGLFRALNMITCTVHLQKIEDFWVSPIIWARNHLFGKHLLGHISVLDLNHI